MDYLELVDVYEMVSATTKRLEKVAILAEFLKKIQKSGNTKWVYLLRGRVVADYDPGEFGISGQLAMKAMAFSFAATNDIILERLKKIGDLGEIAQELAGKKKQSALFSRKLTVQKVFDNLTKLFFISGKGAVEKKIHLIAELLSSANGKEAKYIIRTLLSDLRVGVAEGVVRDAIVEAYFKETKEEMSDIVGEAFEMSGDFARVLDAAAKGRKELEKISLLPGKPVRVMLAVKASSFEEGFEICGKPAALEHKYDGFRMVISKKGKDIFLFTRKLENVTKQFPDVVKAVAEHVKGENYVIDSEVVGYDPKTKKYRPFEAISQRIKRKYEIEKLINELPVEVNVFDVLYYNGQSMMSQPFIGRRKLLESMIKPVEYVIRPAVQLITDDEKKAEEFYKHALEIGEEGVMIKNIQASYKQGRRVGYMAKIKPTTNEFDLVIVGAEYGSGKRGGWLTSFIVACRDGEGFKEVGKVSSGLKELEGEGTSYEEMTNILKPLIIETKENIVKVKPKIVVTVTYQNIQRSPSYDSGFALRFPRINAYRVDRDISDIASLEEIEKEVK